MSCCSCKLPNKTMPKNAFDLFGTQQMFYGSSKIIKSNIFTKFNINSSMTTSNQFYQRLVLLKPNRCYLLNVIDDYMNYYNNFASVVNTIDNTGYSMAVITLLTYNPISKTFTNFSMTWFGYKFVQLVNGNKSLIIDQVIDKNTLVNNLMTILNNNIVYSVLDIVVQPYENYIIGTIQNYLRYNMKLITLQNPPKHDKTIFEVTPNFIENPNIFTIFDSSQTNYGITSSFMTNPDNYNTLMVEYNDNINSQINSGIPFINVAPNSTTSLMVLNSYISNMIKSSDFVILHYYILNSSTATDQNLSIKIKQISTNNNDSVHVNFLNNNLNGYNNIILALKTK